MQAIVTDLKAEYERLYKAAHVADDLFQAAVVRQFGAKQAGIMRYASGLHNPEVKALARAYWAAAKAMLDAKRALDPLR